MSYGLYDGEYVTVAECAQRLGLSEARVMELVKNRVLKSYWDGGFLVQPALIQGVTT